MKGDRVDLSPGCYAVVSPKFDPKDRLNRVHLEFASKDKTSARCGMMVKSTLISKYGEPNLAVTVSEPNSCVSNTSKAGQLAGILCNAFRADADDYEFLGWNTPENSIVFKLHKSVPSIWYADYHGKLDSTADANAEAASKL